MRARPAILSLRTVLAFALVYALAFLPAMLLAAQAANLQISPVSVSFRATQGAAGISLQNFGDQPLHGQVRVFVWDQKDGEDVLVPATDLVASPPIMEVAPKSSQVVRLVRRNAQAAPVERTYRILIDEIPRGDGAASGVAIRLQYSVPVFVLPLDDSAAPRLAWSVLQKNGAWYLRVRNDGDLHAQLGATTLRTAAGKDIQLSKGLLGYALPGRSREWRLPDTGASAGLAPPLAARSFVNAQPAEAAVSLDQSH